MELLWLMKVMYGLLGGCFLYGGYLILGHRDKLATSELRGNKELNDLKGDGIQISKNVILNEKITESHVVILAPTRVGKTTSLFIPNLLQDKIKGSLIITDPKGELYKLTHKYQESIGRKTILYNPLEGIEQYNPLAECKDDREVMQLSQNLLTNGSLAYEIQTGKKSGGIEWLQMAQSLLTATLLKENTISNALGLILSNDIATLDELLTNSKENVKKQYNVFKMCMESPKTMSSIKITLASNLSLFTDNLMINKSTFTSEKLRETPTALYISYPENKSTYLSPLMACIYTQLIDHLIDCYNPNSLPITFLFDEFANQGQLSNFNINIATAASRKMSFILCLQSFSQLKQIYGEYNAFTIWNNCNTKIILSGLTDPETLRLVSDICGYTEILIDQEGKKVKTKKKLFELDEIRRINENELLVICKNKQPILDELNTYFKQDKYLSKVKF